MKTFIENLAVTIIPVIILATVISVSVDVGERIQLRRTSVATQTESAPVIPGSSYAEAMNTLFTSSGR